MGIFYHFGGQRSLEPKPDVVLLTVAQILPELNSGGVEKGTLEVATGLVEAGHRSIVISGGGRLVESLVAGGSEHICLPVGKKSPLTLRMIPKLRAMLRKERVDVLHARSRVPAWLSVLTLKSLPPRLRPAFLTTVHGLYSVNRYSRVMTFGQQVECVSQTVKDYVLTNYPSVPADKLKLIYRGVDPDLFHPEYRATSEWVQAFRDEFDLADRPIVALVGRLTRLKGHFDFLRLMDALKDRRPDAVGLIVGGEDPRRATYAAEIRDAVSKRSNVVLTGYRSDVRDIMSVCSCVVSLSSQPESFGRTVLESLALGVPVAGYEHGGVGEILNTLFADGCVPVGETDRLIETVDQILESTPDAKIGNNTYFTLGRMVSDTLKLYESVGQDGSNRMSGREGLKQP
ncbi:MAG: glycosyltransferase family 4 protein [Planctomycetaceae bacterium]